MSLGRKRLQAKRIILDRKIHFSVCWKKGRLWNADRCPISLVGAVAGGDVAFDAWNLIRPVTLTGYSSETLDGAGLRQAVAALVACLSHRGMVAPEYKTVPMQNAAQAHDLIERGGFKGRLLLVP